MIILDCDNTLWGGVLDEDKDKEILYVNIKKNFFMKTFKKKIKNLKTMDFLFLCVLKIMKKRFGNF